MPEQFQGMMIFSVIFLVLGFICMAFEKRTTGFYKATNVFGRFYAFLAFNALFGGIMFLVVNLVRGNIDEIKGQNTAVTIGSLIITEILGVLMYVRVYKKSPDFLKKRCLVDLTVSGFGVTMRAALWIVWLLFRAQWEYYKPEVYRTSDGTEVYVYKDGSVYDAVSGRHGKRVSSGGGNSVIWD